MRVYVDSSALVKRIFDEPETTPLIASLRGRVEAGDVVASSSLAWVEVSRATRAHRAGATTDIDGLVAVAMSGVVEKVIDAEVVALARRMQPAVLRSLDAIHLATAVLLDADLIVTYDQRLIEAAAYHGVRSTSPT